MHEAVAGFGLEAERYACGRPGYPDEAVEFVIEACGLGPGRVVVDLAAGTGKFTRGLLRSGARVLAVEPVDEMRAQLVAALPEVEARAGTAEATGLPGAVARAVTVAQGFHWFANELALAEIARVLEPAGMLVLVWNRRLGSHPLQAAVSRIIEPYRGGAPSYATGEWRRVIGDSELFRPGREFRCRFTQVVDAEGLAARFGSVSYIAGLPPDEKEQVLARLRGLVPSGTAELPYVTDVTIWDRTSPEGAGDQSSSTLPAS